MSQGDDVAGGAKIKDRLDLKWKNAEIARTEAIDTSRVR